MVEQSNQEIYRGWMIIRGIDVSDRLALAESIFQDVGTDHDENFVVRADTIWDSSSSNDIGLIVPMCAKTVDELEAMAKTFAGTYEYDLAIVHKHVPEYPHRAPGWVTSKEAENPSQGPTGLNPW